MKRIDVKWDGREYVFRTNDSGDYLFTGVGENRQISCESGFHRLTEMKKGIREHLKSVWEGMPDSGYGEKPMPKIQYFPSMTTEWE